MNEPDEQDMPSSQWNHLVRKMRRRGGVGADDDLVDMLTESIDPDDLTEADMSPVHSDEAEFFVFIRSLSGPGGKETLDGYREDQRWAIAEGIRDRIQGGEDLFVIVGDMTELDMVEKCREALSQ